MEMRQGNAHVWCFTSGDIDMLPALLSYCCDSIVGLTGDQRVFCLVSITVIVFETSDPVSRMQMIFSMTRLS
jgi:hypothetical protein